VWGFCGRLLVPFEALPGLGYPLIHEAPQPEHWASLAWPIAR